MNASAASESVSPKIQETITGSLIKFRDNSQQLGEVLQLVDVIIDHLRDNSGREYDCGSASSSTPIGLASELNWISSDQSVRISEVYENLKTIQSLL